MKQTNIMDLTVIIPVHSVEGEFDQLFAAAVNSLVKNTLKPKVIISVTNTNENKKYFTDYKFPDGLSGEVQFTTKKLFQDHINVTVKSVKTKYFTVLEFDDEFADKWFETFESYSSENVGDMFVPLTALFDHKTKTIKQLVNQIGWAKGQVDEVGYPDFELVKGWPDFTFTGAIINTEMFRSLGGLKRNIKFTFNYEFILRMLNKGYKMFIVPRIGYRHTINRDGSLIWQYANDDSIKIKSAQESEFWFEVARTECKYTKDRDIDIPENYA